MPSGEKTLAHVWGKLFSPEGKISIEKNKCLLLLNGKEAENRQTLTEASEPEIFGPRSATTECRSSRVRDFLPEWRR